MGQQESKAPVTLGYSHIKQENVVLQDFILENPHLYQCQQKDLAQDLEYIDQTYYPNIVHYKHEKQDIVVEEWSKLTIDESCITKKTRQGIDVDMSGRSLIQLSPSIGYLEHITKLNISNNQMTALPDEIGYLKNLTILNVSNNRIREIPETIGYLAKLQALNVGHNQLVQLPLSLGQLTRLAMFVANNNQLITLPRSFARLVNLTTLDLSNNPLKYLPIEVVKLNSLIKLLVENCGFAEEYRYDLTHGPPSLFEICARKAIRLDKSRLPEHIKQYFNRVDRCSYCKGPFFDSYLRRVRFIERQRQPIVVEERLCCAHWKDDQDRVLAMFSETLLDDVIEESRNEMPVFKPLPLISK